MTFFFARPCLLRLSFRLVPDFLGIIQNIILLSTAARFKRLVSSRICVSLLLFSASFAVYTYPPVQHHALYPNPPRQKNPQNTNPLPIKPHSSPTPHPPSSAPPPSSKPSPSAPSLPPYSPYSESPPTPAQSPPPTTSYTLSLPPD